MCTGPAMVLRSSTSTRVAMQRAFPISACSISLRPTASHVQTAKIARANSVIATSPVITISGRRSVRARSPPKHANAARNVRRGRTGSSGKAIRRSSARSSESRGGVTSASADCPSWPASREPCADPSSVFPAIAAAILAKSKAGGIGSTAVAVRARDSKLLADCNLLDGGRRDGDITRSRLEISEKMASSRHGADPARWDQNLLGLLSRISRADTAVPRALTCCWADMGTGGGTSGLAATAANLHRAFTMSLKKLAPALAPAPRTPAALPCRPRTRAADASPRSAILTSSCQLAGGGADLGPLAMTKAPARWRSIGARRAVACARRKACKSIRNFCTQISSKMNLKPGRVCGCGTNGRANSGAKLSADWSRLALGFKARKALRSSRSGSGTGSMSTALREPMPSDSAL
mmetsp:Transcript_105663/g.183330  ORF Transcript_105663/g.183330 Transcript_105663/m.183330 type:complete len:409 (-) Transcript_105663:985-2211(-)